MTRMHLLTPCYSQYTPDMSILRLDRIFVPVHHGMHYTCAEVDLRAHELRYYDPLMRVVSDSHVPVFAACASLSHGFIQVPLKKKDAKDAEEDAKVADDAAWALGVEVLGNLAQWVEDEAKDKLGVDLEDADDQRYVSLLEMLWEG